MPVQMLARAGFIDPETDQPVPRGAIFEVDDDVAERLEASFIAVRLAEHVGRARTMPRASAPGWFDVVGWRGERFNEVALREDDAVELAASINAEPEGPAQPDE